MKMLSAQNVQGCPHRISVVCDAPQVQLFMMKKLGADLDPEAVKTTICEDMQESPIHFVNAMCHCIKN